MNTINLVQFPALGIELEINRIAFKIGGLEVYWYGLLICIGMLLAMVFAFSKCRSFGIDDNRFTDVIFLTFIMAVISARVYFIVFAPFKYQSLFDMINLRDGGIAIYGAVIGAAVFGFLFCKLRKIPFLPALDLAAMGFLIGQCIGRWGNFFNQEAFGTNTTGVFGMYSPSTQLYLESVKDTLAADGIIVNPAMPVHPTFLYESIWCLVGFVLLFIYMNRRKFDGEIAIFYAIWYGAGRFVIESVRTDSLMTGFMSLRVSQLVAGASVIGGIIIWLILKKRNAGVTPPLIKDNNHNQDHAKSDIAQETEKAEGTENLSQTSLTDESIMEDSDGTIN